MIGSKPANTAERAHMGRCKQGPCIACLVGVAIGLIKPEHACRGGQSHDGHDLGMMEYNHCLSGRVRRGHMHGFAACIWHHHGSQQVYRLGMTKAEAFARWGPNLFDQSKAFHATFGSDDELIEAQAFVLAESYGAAL